MNIKDIKGLKYPDEYFIRFFFKNSLQSKNNLTFFELGCSNGCNLSLPYQYNNKVIGVDFNEQLVSFANENFKKLDQINQYNFCHRDMRSFCKESKDINSDILILASSIYYIPKNDFISLLRDIKNNNIIKANTLLYIRFREINDFRNHKGQKIEENGYILENNITGEDGAFCKFYSASEMIDILRKELNLRDYEVLNNIYENIQNNTTVYNSDVIVWGTIN